MSKTIQSLSITVPTKGCVNSCKFCVSRLHDNPYQIADWEKQREVNSFFQRLQWASRYNIDTVILTGTGEALQNPKFLQQFDSWNKALQVPFYWIELQTSGVMLEENLGFLKSIGVKTISLSLSDIFDNQNNQEMNGISEKLYFPILGLCKKIKGEGFNLRISMNMTKVYDFILLDPLERDADDTTQDRHRELHDEWRRVNEVGKIFDRLKELEADQVTFRKLYSNDNPTNIKEAEIAGWIKENKCFDKILDYINAYILTNGVKLEKLPFGGTRYSVEGISTVIDDDCMAKNTEKDLKYLILREDGRLYTRWDNKGSLLF